MQHFVGKWDAGMATPKHTPQGRGYDTSLNYFEHKNDFWNSKSMQTSCGGTYDLWDTDQPAFDIAGEKQTQYEEYLFRDRMVSIIRDHDASQPLLLFYASHVAHCPLQVPADKLAAFAALTNGTDEAKCHAQTDAINPEGSPFACRAQYHAMVSVLDDNVRNVTDALKAKGMFDDTLIVFSSEYVDAASRHRAAAAARFCRFPPLLASLLPATRSAKLTRPPSMHSLTHSPSHAPSDGGVQ